MRQFYEKVLGFQADFINEDFVSYKFGESSLALLGENTIESMCGSRAFSEVDKSKHIISLEVASLVESVAQLEEKGVKMITKSKITPWGQHVAYISDPEGNIIELSEPYAEA